MSSLGVRFGLVCVLAWPALSASAPVGSAAAEEDKHGSVGSKAKVFVLDELSGESVRFPDRTEIGVPLTVVVFWATWSRPSISELDRLTELWPMWSSHGVRVVAVNVETHQIGPKELATVRSYLAKKPLPFPAVIDQGLAAFHEYGVVAVPTTLVIDPSGTIVFRLPGYPTAGSYRLIEYVEGKVADSGLEARGEAPERSHAHRRALRHTRLGRLLTVRGEFEMAEYTLKLALEQNPQLLDAHLALAELYEASDRSAEAEWVLAKASEAFKDNSRLLLACASQKMRVGDLPAAGELARRAYVLSPSLSGALLVLAQVRIATHDYEGALEFLTQATAANPLDHEVMIELGRVHELLGTKRLALDWYERAYSLLDPTWHP